MHDDGQNGQNGLNGQGDQDGQDEREQSAAETAGTGAAETVARIPRQLPRRGSHGHLGPRHRAEGPGAASAPAPSVPPARVPGTGVPSLSADGSSPSGDPGPGRPVDGDELPSDEELPPSDALLAAAVRAGDDYAFEELYRRHAAAVRRYARTCCRDAFTAEDLAGEVFARTLQALRAGKGPDIAVRAYLLTAVRNIAATWTRSDRREQLVDDFTAFAASSPAVANVNATDPGADTWAMAEVDHSLVVRAFSRLDKDDRMLLWHTEVEREPPREVALLIGKTANATAVQASRARDRLATEFLQAHISEAQSAACRSSAKRLGAFARGALGKRAGNDVRAHLNDCDRCSAAYLELVDLNHSLRELLPVGALAWVGSGYFVAIVAGVAGGAGTAAVGVAAGATAAGSGGAAGGGGSAAVAAEGLGVPAKAGIAAGVTVVVVAGVAVALALTGGTAHKPQPKPRPVAAAPRPVVVRPRPTPTPTPPAPAPEVQPVVAAAPPVVRPRPRPKPVVVRPRPRPMPRPTPKARPAPLPVADYFVDSLPYSGFGNTRGPSLADDAASDVWQRGGGVRVGGTAYSRGITMDAPSSATIDLNGQCSEFDASVGIDDMTMGLGAVRFSVLDDSTGRTLWQSGIVSGGDPAVPVQVALKGLTAIRLAVVPADGSYLANEADWADARFSCS